MKEKIIVFSAGGTLGHINPALSMIKILKDYNSTVKIVFIMTTKEKKYLFLQNNSDIDEIIYYDVDGFNRHSMVANITNFWKIKKVFKKIKKHLKILKPSKVIGMGGYISAIAIKAALSLKIKTIIHEQNMIMGLANKMICKKVDKVLSAFPINDQVLVVGNPRMIEAHNNIKNILTNNHIVITSGTLGSKKINDVAVEFLKSEVAKRYYTTLITGRKYYDEVIDKLRNNKTDFYEIFPFDEQLLDTLSLANIVICRAGATTIFEIMGLHLPSILIPSPNVTNNHQYYNALFLEEQEAGFLMLEEKLNLESLISAIEMTINNVIYRDNLKKIYRELSQVDWQVILDE